MEKIKKFIIFVLINIGIWINLLIIYFLLKISWLNLWINYNLITLLIVIIILSIIILLIIFLTNGSIIRKIINIQIVEEDISPSVDDKINYIQSKINKLNKKYNISVQLGIYDDYDMNVFTVLNGTKWYLMSFSTWVIENMDIDKLDWIVWYEYMGIKKGTTFLLNILQWFINIFIIYLSYFLIKLVIKPFKKPVKSFLIFILTLILWLFITICIFIILKIKYGPIYPSDIKSYTNLKNILYALQRMKIYSEYNNDNYFNKKEELISSLEFNISDNIMIWWIPYHNILDNRIKNIPELIK